MPLFSASDGNLNYFDTSFEAQRGVGFTQAHVEP
jgi:hypothetical protein